MKKLAGSGSESGSTSQRHGSGDPDPFQNVMDPQHWKKGSTLRQCFFSRSDKIMAWLKEENSLTCCVAWDLLSQEEYGSSLVSWLPSASWPVCTVCAGTSVFLTTLVVRGLLDRSPAPPLIRNQGQLQGPFRHLQQKIIWDSEKHGPRGSEFFHTNLV